MRFLAVNPNCTASMTVKIGAAARAASSGTEIVAVDPGEGPVSIEGYWASTSSTIWASSIPSYLGKATDQNRTYRLEKAPRMARSACTK